MERKGAMGKLQMYGFEVHGDGTATLSLMTDVGAGNGDLNPHTGTRMRWECEDVKTGGADEIEAECSRLNREIAETRRMRDRMGA
jgi:hypothetical protein